MCLEWIFNDILFIIRLRVKTGTESIVLVLHAVGEVEQKTMKEEKSGICWWIIEGRLNV